MAIPADTGYSPTLPRLRWWRFLEWLRAWRGPATASGTPGSGATARGRTRVTNLQLEELMLDHGEAAYRVALSVTRSHEMAEDVTQDAMLKAWQGLPHFRGEAPLRSWVLRIAHNTAISALRKQRELLRPPDELPDTVVTESVEREAHGRMALAAFESAVNDLDELSRSIVVLREIESLSYDEIAKVLDVPIPTVKTRLLRARRHLAAALEGWRP